MKTDVREYNQQGLGGSAAVAFGSEAEEGLED